MTPQEEKIIKLSSEKIKQCLYEESRKYSNAQIRNIEIYVESLINKTIQNYQTNFEQKHIASAVEVAKAEAVRKFIDQEIERRKGMKKEYPQIKEFPEKYKDNMEVNSETLPIAMHNAIAMNYIGSFEYGYNQAIDEDIAHLTSLKELYK